MVIMMVIDIAFGVIMTAKSVSMARIHLGTGYQGLLF